MFDRLMNKYLNKLKILQNSDNLVYYYFNTYGSVIPTKYYILLNTISNMFNLKRASDNYYTITKRKLYNLITDDHYSKLKLTIGSFNTVFTLLTENSLLNFMISDDNTCYIETFTGYSPILLDTLKDICKEYGILYIETCSTYKPEYDYLLEYGFSKNKYNSLIYIL
jgi:hypothetical protein